MQDALDSIADSFVRWLVNGNKKDAAQKQQMMEELERRKAEAVRQHNIEEAQRLEAICNRLSTTLKLSGLPDLPMKVAGSQGGGLRLKTGDGDDGNRGIRGLPGIALNDTTGNGGNTPYGIPGLPGIYTNGPGSGSGGAALGGSALQLKTGDESAPLPTRPNAIATAPTPAEDSAMASKLAEGLRDPQSMTPQQLAAAATLVGKLSPEEQQRLIDAARASSPGATVQAGNQPAASGDPNPPTVSQLQQVADASRSAAIAPGLEDAAAKARIGFDLPAQGTVAGSVPAPAKPFPSSVSPQNPPPAASAPKQGVANQASATPAPAAVPAPRPPGPATEPAAKGVREVKGVAGSQCPAGIEKAIPSRQQLQTELAARRVELENLHNTIVRLSRNIQLDRQQYAAWEEQAKSAVERLKGRIWDLGSKAIFDGFIDFQKARYQAKEAAGLLTTADQAQVRRLGLLKNLKDFDDYRKWALEEKGDWEKIDGGLRQIADLLPLKAEPMFYIHCAQYVIDNAYDVVDWTVTWDNLRQLDRNSTQFLEAVRLNGERMRAIVGRIREIETQLNATPAAPSNASPCREAPAQPLAQ